MKNVILTLGALVGSTGLAAAGAIDRGTQSTAVIFETGNHVELTFGYLSPSVTGTEVTIPGSPTFNGSSSGEMYRNYITGSLSIKTQIQDGLDAAFIIDRPFGADTSYPLGTGYVAAGTTASLESTSYTALLKYRFANQVSLLGGIRYQTLSAKSFIPFITSGPSFAPYSVVGEQDDGFGYVLGVAWEKPEIAARVSLTYNSAIDFDLPTTETSFLGGPVSSTSQTKTPQSVNLEFQTGIAPNMLLFGGVRWVDWEQFRISPPVYIHADPAAVRWCSTTAT
jgi:long-chain fatty acid transport protein